MKILQINAVYKKGSTGKITYKLHKKIVSEEWDSKVAYRYYEENTHNVEEIQTSSWLDCHIHNRLARITMLQGCFSSMKTQLFLEKLKKYSPDLIHLHNIHGSFVNHSMLFKFIKKHNIPVIWTLHDCWSFTGYCAYFTLVKCEKWVVECKSCPQHRQDPVNIFDLSKPMYHLKKKWFTGVQNMTIITPSQWLSNLVKDSYLKNYPNRVINNGIDLGIFKPSPSSFREKYNLVNKFIVVGVAFEWGKRKGLDVFIYLAGRLSDQYQIILIGTDSSVDKFLPDNIISIHRTQNQVELAQIYTAADVFANPTREEVFGLVNVEALACGTPVITFNTGGSPECIDETCGSVVACDDNDAMEAEIIRVCETKPYSQAACLEHAKRFDMNDRFREYIELYKKHIERN